MHPIQLSQRKYWKRFKISYLDYRFWIQQIIVFVADIGDLVKALSNHEATLSPENLENIRNFQGWGLTLNAY